MAKYFFRSKAEEFGIEREIRQTQEEILGL
jgi:hypothetical protein